jgi:hypothetical protein
LVAIWFCIYQWLALRHKLQSNSEAAVGIRFSGEHMLLTGSQLILLNASVYQYLFLSIIAAVSTEILLMMPLLLVAIWEDKHGKKHHDKNQNKDKGSEKHKGSLRI